MGNLLSNAVFAKNGVLPFSDKSKRQANFTTDASRCRIQYGKNAIHRGLLQIEVFFGGMNTQSAAVARVPASDWAVRNKIYFTSSSMLSLFRPVALSQVSLLAKRIAYSGRAPMLAYLSGSDKYNS